MRNLQQVGRHFSLSTSSQAIFTSRLAVKIAEQKAASKVVGAATSAAPFFIFSRNYCGVRSKPNHFIDNVFNVPSALAAVIASSNLAFRAVSLLRRPTELPAPRKPP